MIKTKTWLDEINTLKGFAILLVVFGHIANRSDASFNNGIYTYIKNLIYIFHMPLFFFLSGVIAFYSIRKLNNFSFNEYIKPKISRILVPYFIFAFITLIIKFILSKKDFSELLNTLPYIIYDPINNYIGSVWFLYVLFFYTLILPIIYNLTKKSWFLVLITLVILYFIDLKGYYFGLSLSLKYLIFFTLGGLYLEKREEILNIIMNQNNIYTILLLITFLILSHFYISGFVYLKIFATTLGIIISILSIKYIKGISLKTFDVLGKNTMAIYLLSPFIITASRLISLKFYNGEIISFFLITLGITILAIVIPIYLKKYFFNKFNFTKKLLG